MSDEDEVTYDIHADSSSKLTKSLQKAIAKSTKQSKFTTPSESSAAVVAPAIMSRQSVAATLMEKGQESDEDEEDGFASILLFEPPVSIVTLEGHSGDYETSTQPKSPSVQHTTHDTSRRIPRSQNVASSNRHGLVSDLAPIGPSQHRIRQLHVQATPRKVQTTQSFESAFERPSHWLKTPPLQSLPKRTNKVATTKRQPPALLLLSTPPPQSSTPYRKSMAELLRQATAGGIERVPNSSPTQPRNEDIEDAGYIASEIGTSQRQLPFHVPPKEKRRKRLSDVTIPGEIGAVVQRATRKASRDATLFHTNSHQAPSTSSMIDAPQSRPSITICLLRTRLVADFAVFTAYIHQVSPAIQSSPPPSPPLLPIRSDVIVDAVFSKSALAKLRDNVLVTLYAPFHILSLDGPYPFPLLLGTQLFQVSNAVHSCQTALPFDDEWA
ncbi:hypothetical protein H310_14135 [Aphanomyces invadans]|uniref:Uncharacterized protein n=1 Tax=Aphanomyces invadans TaxID=157072 RepID=A0A024TB03_9STRA|nr:hypothetical protein H310_14135 [Aphanomyces invadans]ETV91315.1 hypothetical protein H310_14135 [Aphanomyces invadans]|eukprot:XP_008880152.1 hypothetical protein H310_14135 [Aphanomyces invadans]